MPARLVCPSCGRALTISDHAPAQLTCPNCLAPLTNPMAGDIRPLPVIPVDREANFDAKATTRIFFALIALLGIGAVMSLTTVGGASGIFNLLIAGSLSPGDGEFAGQFAAFVADVADDAHEPIDGGLFELVGDQHELVRYAPAADA